MTMETEQSKLTDFALGELDAADEARVQAMLEQDSGARHELEVIEETLEAVRLELRSAEPPKLDERRRSAIAERAKKTVVGRPSRRSAYALSGLLAAAASALVFVSTSREPELAVHQVPEGTVSGSPLPRSEVAPAPPPTPRALEPEPSRPSSAGPLGRDLTIQDLVESGPERVLARKSGELYDAVRDNSFVQVNVDPLSTFSVDVDTASYAIVRRFLLEQNRLPPRGAVRIEELVNYFDYSYPEPRGGRPFSVKTDVAEAPWAPSHRLVRIGIRGKSLAQREVAGTNLVFLIDVSGSMADENKLPLLRRAFSLLVERLGARDRVAIVVYAGSSGLVLPSTSGHRHGEILRAIERLDAGGSTNGGEGIELAYREARRGFVKGGVNRVILATDGDFNVGVTSQSELVELIQREAKSDVFLSVLGFGSGNYNDAMLEKLADKGNGNYAYIDSFSEARKVLVEEAAGTLVTIAKDVKVQIEWNPAEVAQFRLIGYENRVLSHRDFNDDRKDAGEVGAEHEVTALYEVVPAGESGESGEDALKYQRGPAPAASRGELGMVKLRYKEPEGVRSELLEVVVRDNEGGLQRAPADFRFAAAVAEFGMLLRQSPHRGQASYDEVIELAESATAGDERRAEFVRMVRRARAFGED